MKFVKIQGNTRYADQFEPCATLHARYKSALFAFNALCQTAEGFGTLHELWSDLVRQNEVTAIQRIIRSITEENNRNTGNWKGKAWETYKRDTLRYSLYVTANFHDQQNDRNAWFLIK
jgi:hypothetical protein